MFIFSIALIFRLPLESEIISLLMYGLLLPQFLFFSLFWKSFFKYVPLKVNHPSSSLYGFPIIFISFSSLKFWSVGGGPPAECSQPPWVKISLPRHDLLGEERWWISQRRRARSLFLNGLLLHSNTGRIRKAHQSLSGWKDQTIDNVQRTMRAYSDSGSDS